MSFIYDIIASIAFGTEGRGVTAETKINEGITEVASAFLSFEEWLYVDSVILKLQGCTGLAIVIL